MARFSSAKRVDRLRIVTDNRDSFVGLAECLQDIHLQSVHVLIFINQDVVERACKAWAQSIIEGCGSPEQQKVVEVEHASSSLAGDVSTANLDYLLDSIVCPRRHCRRDGRDGIPGVYGSRIDVEKKGLAWESLATRLRVAAFFSHEVNDVGGIGRVEY
jgi:hypothetical protein